MYRFSSFAEGTRHARARLERWLLGNPDPRQGRRYLAAAAMIGLVWLSSLYVQYRQPWFSGTFFFALWLGLLGASDALPRRLRAVSVALRAATVALLVGVVVWTGASWLTNVY